VRLITGLLFLLMLSDVAGADQNTLAHGANLPANCAVGDVFVKTTAPVGLHHCTATDTWTQLGSASGNVTAADKTRTCTVVVGDPGAGSPALSDDNDSPVACGNEYSADWTIQTVSCWANAGSPTVTPILTGGSATSILTGALTCGTAAWASGTVQASAPVVHSFSGTGSTCSSTPCSIDVNISSAGGVAKYVVIRISGSLP
jgi:hypothetical protein